MAMNSVNFDTSIKGKNTPRVLMNANNGRMDTQLISADIVVNKSVAQKVKEIGAAAAHRAEVGHDTGKMEHAPLQPINLKNSTNSSSQKGVAISSRDAASPLASDMVHLDPVPSQKGPDSLQLLHKHMVKLNEKQRVLNDNKFPPLSNDGGLVLIVQVHKRENYLKQLFESLRKAKGIENVLLVISHDYYYDDMNTVVESVDFCRVAQIFFPYSLQVFPDTFPGESKDDCPRDASKEKAQKLNCTNAEHPDSYGHYREAKVTAIKHHWWWKVNTVFDRLYETQNYSGYVIFLEEDHIVAPDFIEVAKQLIGMRNSQCTDCDFINLGMYNKVKNYAGVAHRATVGIWNAGKNNMGFGFNRETWNVIKGCAENFCSYDDYNWDWSLNTLGTACLGRPLKVLVVKAPRILHIGTCGTHHHKSCNEQEQARIANDKLNAQKANFFPASMSIDPGTNPAAPRKKPKNYGGWGDVRDHRLCLSFVQR